MDFQNCLLIGYAVLSYISLVVTCLNIADVLPSPFLSITLAILVVNCVCLSMALCFTIGSRYNTTQNTVHDIESVNDGHQKAIESVTALFSKQIIRNERTDECPICLEHDGDRLNGWVCCHRCEKFIHSQCLAKAFVVNRNCPLCRAEMG